MLIEIKTGSTASDIYEGVGQLKLYHRMLGLSDRCRLVLLLPEAPSSALRDALNDIGITVSLYTRRESGAVRVEYDDLLLRHCGVPAQTRR